MDHLDDYWRCNLQPLDLGVDNGSMVHLIIYLMERPLRDLCLRCERVQMGLILRPAGCMWRLDNYLKHLCWMLLEMRIFTVAIPGFVVGSDFEYLR